MSGHSKWHSIKHKKALIDAKRNKVFTKVIKELMIAARVGGGSDPASNPRLRTAIQAAKDVNMPKDTLERAIKKGAGELEGQAIEEMVYEGYGPGGVAVMLKVSSDNRNRSAGEIRHAFGKFGGNLGASGSVGFIFSRKGHVDVEGAQEDELMEIALEAGAEDIQNQGDGYFLIVTDQYQVQEVRDALEAKGVKVTGSRTELIPSTTVKLEGVELEKCQKMLDFLEDMDDVDEVASNLEYPEE
ncbi:YebC/PmpR family DNA-binding transcriptional regulator [bacterium]|nr:YebC/PmpR family DNA-binding transcriptional regulator [bacterium]